MKKKFLIEGMTCTACQGHVFNAGNNLKDVSNVNVNLITNTLELDTNLNNQEIISAVKLAGYKATPIEENIYQKKDNTQKNKLIISLVFWVLLMIIAMGSMANIPLLSFFMTTEGAIYYSVIQIVLLVPIVILNFHYFINGFKRLFKLAPTMDSLVAIGSTFSILYGIYGTIMIIYGMSINNETIIHQFHHDLYFEGAGTILTLVSVGKFIETHSKAKTSNALNMLLDLTGKKTLLVKDNKEEEIDIDQIEVGNILKIIPGMSIPVDGKIIKGTSNVDESSISGEAIPILKNKNSKVISGTMNLDGVIYIKATSTIKTSTLSQIIKMVEDVSLSKAPLTRIADKVSGVFVPIVIGLALITFIIWICVTRDFAFSISLAISVLVISCPCALGLATPIAAMIASGIGAKNHILFKNHEALEKLSVIDTVVLDKTGTITNGKPIIKSYTSYDDKFFNILYGLEKNSSHPLAKCIVNYCKENKIKGEKLTSIKNIPGLGIKGNLNNIEFYAGNKKLFEKFNLDLKMINENNSSLIILGTNNKLYGYVLIDDTLKDNSSYAISLFKKDKIRTIMLTGDQENNAQYVKDISGVDEAYGNLLPIDKANKIIELNKNHKTLMIGDGINDAVALESAFVSMAIGAGSDIALESSDIILSSNDLLSAYNAYRLSKKTITNIKFNLFWAFFYNVIAIPLAMGALYIPFGIKLNPMIASFAMCLSSISVVLTAMTLFNFKNVEVKTMEKEIFVEGMMCTHCEHHVKEALEKIKGVKEATPDFKTGKVILKCSKEIKNEDIAKAVLKAGYKLK